MGGKDGSGDAQVTRGAAAARTFAREPGSPAPAAPPPAAAAAAAAPPLNLLHA